MDYQALIQSPQGVRSLAHFSLPSGLCRGFAEFTLNLPGHPDLSLPCWQFKSHPTADLIRIGIFAGIHGDEPAGVLAVWKFFQELAHAPEVGEGFEILAYPVCNPTGLLAGTRHSRFGVDLNREFWKDSPHPEVKMLENELASRKFQGLIQLHADDTSEGIYGFVRGATLTENLLRPALQEAGKILPRNINAQIDGFAAREGMIHEVYDGILRAPSRLEPAPFEIIFETPGLAPIEKQVEALVVAIQTILWEYRKLIAFAQDL